jgi:sulfite reductase alpha subunit-like flavoprotein
MASIHQTRALVNLPFTTARPPRHHRLPTPLHSRSQRFSTLEQTNGHILTSILHAAQPSAAAPCFRELLSVKWTDGTVSPDPLPHLHLHHTLQHNLLWAIDLTSPPSKSLLATLAASTTDPCEAATLRFLASRDGRAAYKVDIVEGRPNILQLLRRYRSCRLSISRLLELLSPLRPRQYSLANAPAAEAANEVLECAFTVVEYDTHWGAHGGVATTWLERKGADKDLWQQHFPVCLRPTTGFRVPVDTSAPIIMVGPGTGVAPFRGFLQTRAAAAMAGAALGDSWLFTGNWRKDWDYLYGEELESFVADGTLKHLVLAWSREGDTKVRPSSTLLLPPLPVVGLTAVCCLLGSCQLCDNVE